jgi:flagellar hook-basal body complex protein FliE
MIDALSLSTARLAPGSSAGGSERVASLGVGVGAAGAASGVDFADVLAQVSGNAVQALKTAETQSVSALQGTASLREVVDAVKSAEQALQVTISIRDKVVAAYQEISRMAI